MPSRIRTGDWPCPIARTADLIGDAWAVLIMRDAMMGIRRFEDFQRNLDAPRSVLTARLQQLVDAGMLTRTKYQDRPVRHEYRLSDQGRAFWEVLAAMWRWGDDWLFDGGAPIVLTDATTGTEIRPTVVDAHTGEPVDVRATRIRRR